MANIFRIVSLLKDLDGNPLDIGAEDINNKGVPSGYAGLDANGQIDPAQLNVSIDFWDNEL
jgi:hypothetical protein